MAGALTQKAAVLLEPGVNPKFYVKEIPRPKIGPTEVLLQLSVTSVCGTDYGLARGEFGPTRTVLGHEGVGRIVAIGAEVLSVDPTVAMGQRVGVAWNRDVCGRCATCANLSQDGETRCMEKLISGLAADGTFAQYATVPARYLIHLPPYLDNVPDELAAPVLCAGVTAYKALKTSGARPGQYVAISGVGGVGLLALAYAKAMGLRTIGIDVNAAKGVIARGPHGNADHYVDLSALPPASVPDGPFASAAGAAVKALTLNGQGVAAVIVTSGAPAAYQAAFGMLAPFGTLVCVGVSPLDKTVQFNPLAFINRGWRLIGSVVGTRADIMEALEFVQRGQVKPLVKLGRLEDIEQIVNEVGQGKSVGKHVIRLNGAGEHV